jgi:hypothetical protein
MNFHSSPFIMLSFHTLVFVAAYLRLTTARLPDGRPNGNVRPTPAMPEVRKNIHLNLIVILTILLVCRSPDWSHHRCKWQRVTPDKYNVPTHFTPNTPSKG